jgi:hypothetical protein
MDKDMSTDKDMDKDMDEILCLLTKKRRNRRSPKWYLKNIAMTNKFCWNKLIFYNSSIHEFSLKFIVMTDKLRRNERKHLPHKHPQMSSKIILQ